MFLYNRSRICGHGTLAAVYNIQKRFILKWFKRKQPSFENVIQEIQSIYTKKLLPLEKRYLFHEFYSPILHEQYFQSKPMVILIGQYSTGKTTLIKHLLDKDFPGFRIGPEPTTDRFIIIMKGKRDSIIPGNALATDTTRQFNALSKFGNTFLNKIQCSLTDSPVLDSVTFVDTPGILSGKKQILTRGYDFGEVLHWFSERADRIILLFDANKLDISDEFRDTIEAIKRYDNKIRILLNKADSIDAQSLLRVYGALMWSLGKVFQTPEVPRVYVGSFWDNPLVYDTNRKLFTEEEQNLLEDIETLPRQGVLHKINDLNKRARLAIVHAYIISEISARMPSYFGQNKKKLELIENVEEIYTFLQKTYSLSSGDFPEKHELQRSLLNIDFARFNNLNTRMIEVVQDMMDNDIPRIISLIPEDGITDIEGGAFTDLSSVVDLPLESQKWSLNKSFNKYKDTFLTLNPLNGKLTIKDALLALEKSRLPNALLYKICYLSDIDCDGQFDVEEFTVAMHLIDMKKNGDDIPKTLPLDFIPPAKKTIVNFKEK